MTDSRSWPRLCGRLACLGTLVLSALPVLSGTVRAAEDAALLASHDAGTWDLAFEKGNRRCRVNLEASPNAAGFDIGMPAGCRRAFPALATVRAWTPGDRDHVMFDTDAGRPLVDFAPSGGPNLSAMVAETDLYTLTPTDQARQEEVRLAGQEPAPPPAPSVGAADPGVMVDTTVASAKVSAPSLKPAVASEVAGHYAVLRQGRDTGCMVTLEEGAKGPKAAPKARLAPACRDQGIVIFDPVGWQIAKGQLVLTAKKGHTTVLSQRDERTWANAPPKGAALMLKRL